jgi:RNA polymerase sigma-70 factor (ECF subfamily)
VSRDIQNDNVVYPDFGNLPLDGDLFVNSGENALKVSSWTAEDFAKVYVRYRPRLESYARKYLRDQSEIDEVIQDAFMYLFLSQPELDSELGVLKFLQWKTRLLCMDILRAQGRRPLAVLNDSDNYDLNLDSIDSAESEYDRMFDVAIVHAALARIPDRQREALIRAEFQEQSAAEIGAELGVSENAARQLLSRARRSFRTELISQVNIAGIEVSEILSVAVRKAKEISKNAGAMIVVLLLPLAVTLGFQYFSNNLNNVTIVEPNTSVSNSPSVSPDGTPTPSDENTPESNKNSTPNGKPSSDAGQALKDDGVISRKSEVRVVSPTLIMSDFPFNADGLVLTSDNPNVTTAILTSFEGDKVEVVVSRDQSRIEIQFKVLIRGSSSWQSVEIVNLERTLTSSGGLVINAIVVDNDGKKWGVSIVFDAGYTSVMNARIVGI